MQIHFFGVSVDAGLVPGLVRKTGPPDGKCCSASLLSAEKAAIERPRKAFSFAGVTSMESIMTEHNNLPDNADLRPIYEACKQIVSCMRDEGKSLDAIASDINRAGFPINTSALQTFLLRQVKQRINRDNKTLKYVYNYIVTKRHAQHHNVKSAIAQNWRILTKNAIEFEFSDEKHRKFTDVAAAQFFGSWFHISEQEMGRVASKLAGKFVMLRKSISDKDIIVVSILDIQKMDHSIKSGVTPISVTHTHFDMYLKKRISTGFLLPVVRNLYFIMKVEDGEGIEFISLKEPIQRNFEKNLGFLTSINTDRKILSSRVFIERITPDWIEAGKNGLARFNLTDQSLPNWIRSNMSTYLQLLDEGKSQTIPMMPISPINPFESLEPTG